MPPPSNVGKGLPTYFWNNAVLANIEAVALALLDTAGSQAVSDSRYFCASSAAIQPVPALVTA